MLAFTHVNTNIVVAESITNNYNDDSGRFKPVSLFVTSAARLLSCVTDR